MGFTLDNVVPWGRSYEEYVTMFSLSNTDLKRRILGCGDGPASFNASLTGQGGHVISIDPIYKFTTMQIKHRLTETYDVVIEQLRKNINDYVWDAVQSVDGLGQLRMSAMDLFLSDFGAGKKEGRYIAGELPSLPFKNKAFDLALSSHFLFLYSGHFSEGFHLQALQDMLRVADEVRVFPLVTLSGERSPHLAFVTDSLKNQGVAVEIREVAYEFQRGGNQMLALKR